MSKLDRSILSLRDLQRPAHALSGPPGINRPLQEHRRPNPPHLRRYGPCLDDEIGRVVAALDQKGIRDNTLIVFHSDNGGTRSAMFAGVMADMSKVKIPCDNGRYRERKGTLYEGATRVCALANWPGQIEPAAP